MSTQHIGAAGELLVQYKLLKLGIDSARLTTDAGIDLVVYAPAARRASTVQVKANLAPKPAGGRGPLSRGWYFPHVCPAELVALVALDVDQVWLFTLDEACGLAQQLSERGIHQLYWQIEAGPTSRPVRLEADMNAYLLEHRAATSCAIGRTGPAMREYRRTLGTMSRPGGGAIRRSRRFMR